MNQHVTSHTAHDRPDTEAMKARYRDLSGTVRRRQMIEAGQAAALPFAAYAYGDAMKSSGLLKRSSHWAQLFCIAAAGIVPILLFIRVVW